MVARVACTKFLGVLMKNCHGQTILNLQEYLIKQKKSINLSTLVTLYHSFFYHYLTYCLEQKLSRP